MMDGLLINTHTMTPDEIIEEFNHDHTTVDRDCLLVKRLRAHKFKKEEIANVLLIIDNLCKVCFNTDINEKPCYCYREE